MVRKKYQGQFKLELLMDQLVVAFPEWKVDNNWLGSVVKLPDGIAISFPESTLPGAVDAVVANHNPLEETQNERDRRQRIFVLQSIATKLQGLGFTNEEIKEILRA